MIFNTFVGQLAQHWVLISLVLCPIVVVMMALAALRCEACGAPFGIFRRRNRTIDLCLRCALLHDFRRAAEIRESGASPARSQPLRPRQVPSPSRNVKTVGTQHSRRLGSAQTGHPGAD